MTAIVLCTCDESYQGEGEGATLLTQNTFVECGRKITISEELVSVRQITCKTTRFLGLSPTPVFIQKHFLMGPSNKIFGEESFDFAILNPIKIIRIRGTDS